MKQRYHMIVKGRVQGVGFRYFTTQWAERFHITGWVRNLYDGSVEIEAEGKMEDLDDFMKKIKEGPRFGYVETMDVVEMDAVGNEKSFRVMH
ncbi:acylphosphatase [Dethiosulfatibacter aminovorans DSM 17477]|uniref:Acylphosphatase n=1 Tax=Dethiosulfatibacter aminovorans DSM 17477 TaxID=1121476 RepID=A0A1M6LNM6_9FIRM|nr:acylphosphatase [Dethiosulfatibacter aminovorans]SHJ72682.1 acylphosphatase [Dethiosulfatibacter aminovorans DSM 17477]